MSCLSSSPAEKVWSQKLDTAD